ncbi:MAG: hypothetical protein OEX77_11975, partial [Candidatus Bathyarchaeota archaeon]|nr:hypothetical protein [Candidatus Bathyarchaeota archaeon]
MISTFHRMIFYAAFIISMGIIGTVITISPIEVYWGITFAFFGLVFFAIVELYLGLEKWREEPIAKVIYGEDELKRVYKSLRGDRDCTQMYTIWCTQYANVEGYFEEERGDFRRNDRLNINRLINPFKVNAKPKDFENHIEHSEDLISQGKYSIAATDLDEVECVICDYERGTKKERKALFVFNDQKSNTPKLGILLDPAKHLQIGFAVDALKSWFD